MKLLWPFLFGGLVFVALCASPPGESYDDDPFRDCDDPPNDSTRSDDAYRPVSNIPSTSYATTLGSGSRSGPNVSSPLQNDGLHTANSASTAPDCVPVQQLPGERPNSVIYHRSDGFYFYAQRSGVGVIYLRCRHSRTSIHCPARGFMHPDLSNLQHDPHSHNHEGDLRYSLENSLVESLIRNARERPCQRIDVIFHEVSSRYPANITARVSLQGMRCRMRRAQMMLRPPIPENFAGANRILLNRTYQGLIATLNGTDSIYLGIAGINDGQQSLVFSSRRLMAELPTFQMLFFDGTFYCKPTTPRCSQLFTVVGVRDNHVLPLIHILMQGRSQECYVEVFNFLLGHVPNLAPHTIMSDFEPALFSSIRQCFPAATHSGCLWHYASSLCRRMRELGLNMLIRANENLRSVLRMALAIPLCPSNLIADAVDIIVEEGRRRNLGGLLDPFLDYLRNQWLTRVSPGVLSFGAPHRTNNVNECHNRNLNAKVGVKRPNIWKFLDVMKQVEDVCWRDIERLGEGINPSRLRKRSVLSNNRRIQSCSRQLQNGEMSLRSVLRTTCYTLEGVFRDSFKSELREDVCEPSSSTPISGSVSTEPSLSSIQSSQVFSTETCAPNMQQGVSAASSLPTVQQVVTTVPSSPTTQSIASQPNINIQVATPVVSEVRRRCLEAAHRRSSSTPEQTVTTSQNQNASDTALPTVTSLGSALMRATAQARGSNSSANPFQPEFHLANSSVRTLHGWVASHRIYAEGDCLYRALAHQIRHQFSSNNLRQMAVNFLLRNSAEYSLAINDLVDQLTETGEIVRGFQSYSQLSPQQAALQTLRLTGTWGGMESIVALSNVLQRNILVYVEGGHMVPIQSQAPVVSEEPLLVIHRLVRQPDGTLRHTHFDSVLSVSVERPPMGVTLLSRFTTASVVAVNAASYLDDEPVVIEQSNRADSGPSVSNAHSQTISENSFSLSSVVLFSDDESFAPSRSRRRTLSSDDDEFQPPRTRPRRGRGRGQNGEDTGARRQRPGRGRARPRRGARSGRNSPRGSVARPALLRTLSVDVQTAVPGRVPLDNETTSARDLERHRWLRCCICNDFEGAFAVQPCGGFPVCNVCIRRWLQSGHTTCPHCRGPITDVVRIRNVNPE